MLLCSFYDLVHGRNHIITISVIERRIATEVSNSYRSKGRSGRFSDVFVKFSLKLQISVGDLKFYIICYHVNIVIVEYFLSLLS